MEKEPPLTDEERRWLRDVKANDEKVVWFWKLVRMWAAWIAGGVLAVFSLVEGAKKLWVGH